MNKDKRHQKFISENGLFYKSLFINSQRKYPELNSLEARLVGKWIKRGDYFFSINYPELYKKFKNL